MGVSFFGQSVISLYGATATISIFRAVFSIPANRRFSEPPCVCGHQGKQRNRKQYGSQYLLRCTSQYQTCRQYQVFSVPRKIINLFHVGDSRACYHYRMKINAGYRFCSLVAVKFFGNSNLAVAKCWEDILRLLPIVLWCGKCSGTKDQPRLYHRTEKQNGCDQQQDQKIFVGDLQN